MKPSKLKNKSPNSQISGIQKDDLKKDIMNDRPLPSLDNLREDQIQLNNHQLQKKFREFHNETGKYPNWGTQIRKEFINFIENQRNDKSNGNA